MTLPVRPYAPKCRVRFWSATEGMIDVTERDLLYVNLESAVNEPTGKWDLLLTGRKTRLGTLFDRLQPQDYIEIELSRVPSAGGFLTLSMRGFVDNIHEPIEASGSWRVSVNGRNYGKILINTEVYYLNELDPAVSLVPQARLEINFGIPGGIITPRQFVQLVDDKILAPNVAGLREEIGRIPQLHTTVTVPDRFAVNGLSVQPFTGSVWNLFTQYATRPWVETFIADEPGGPTLFYRWTPYKDYWTGELLSPYAAMPRTFDISLADIQSHSLGKSDNEVKTYFFTYPTYAFLDRSAFKAEGLDLRRNPYVDEAKLRRYGFRPLEIATPLIPALAGDPADLAAQARPDLVEMGAELNQWLVAANRDNDRFANGTVVVKGGGEFQPGCYARIRGMGREGYIASVSQSFSVQEGKFLTTLGLVRVRPDRSVPRTVGGVGGGRIIPEQ